MTSIEVETTSYQVEKRDWLLSPHGTEPGAMPSVTVDFSLFTAATHAPNGYIPSGIVLAKVTATGLYGPYDPDGSDGRETAKGHLFGQLKFPASGTGKAGGAILRHGFVDAAKLPLATAGNGTEGKLDAAARTDLGLIDYEN